jgi:hypothetical protein
MNLLCKILTILEINQGLNILKDCLALGIIATVMEQHIWVGYESTILILKYF